MAAVEAVLESSDIIASEVSNSVTRTHGKVVHLERCTLPVLSYFIKVLRKDGPAFYVDNLMNKACLSIAINYR